MPARGPFTPSPLSTYLFDPNPFLSSLSTYLTVADQGGSPPGRLTIENGSQANPSSQGPYGCYFIQQETQQQSRFQGRLPQRLIADPEDWPLALYSCLQWYQCVPHHSLVQKCTCLSVGGSKSIAIVDIQNMIHRTTV